MEKIFDSEPSSFPSPASSYEHRLQKPNESYCTKLTSDISDSDSMTSISFVFDSTRSQKSTQTSAEYLGEQSDNDRKSERDKSDMSTGSGYSLIESPNFSPYHATSFCGDHSNVTNDFIEHPHQIKPDISKKKLNNRKRAIIMRRSSVCGVAGDPERILKSSSERFSSWISGSTSEPIFEESESELDIEKCTESGVPVCIHSTPISEMHCSQTNQNYYKQEKSREEIQEECLSSPGSSTHKIFYDTSRSPSVSGCDKTKTASLYERKSAARQNALKVSFGSRQLASLRCAEEQSEKKLFARSILHGGHAEFKGKAKHADCVRRDGVLVTVQTEEGRLVCISCSVACTPQGPSIEVDKVVNSIVLTKRRLSSSNTSGLRVKQIRSWNSIDDEKCYDPLPTFDSSKDVALASKWSPTQPDMNENKTRNMLKKGLVRDMNEKSTYDHLLRDSNYFAEKQCDTTDCSNDTELSRSFPCITKHQNNAKISDYMSAPKLRDEYYSFSMLTSESSYLQHLRNCDRLSPVIQNILKKYSIDINQLTRDINSAPAVPQMSNTDLENEAIRNMSVNNNIDSQQLTAIAEHKGIDDASPPTIACKKSSRKFSFFSKNAIVERSKSIGSTNKALKHSSKSVMFASAVVDRDLLGATGGVYNPRPLGSTSSTLRPVRSHDAETTEDEYEPAVLEEFAVPKRKSSFKDKFRGFRFKSDRRNDAPLSEDDLKCENKVGRRSSGVCKATGKEVQRESSVIVAKNRDDSNYVGDEEAHMNAARIDMKPLARAAVDRYLKDDYHTKKSSETNVGSKSAVEIRPKRSRPSRRLVDDWKDDSQQSFDVFEKEELGLVIEATSSQSIVIPLCSKTKIHFEDTVYYYPSPLTDDDEHLGALVTVSEGKVLKHGDGSEMKLVAKEVSSQMSGKPLRRQKSILHRMRAFFGRSSSSKDAMENSMYNESVGDKAIQMNKESGSEMNLEEGAVGGEVGMPRSARNVVDSVLTNEIGEIASGVVEDEFSATSQPGLHK